MIWPDMQRSDDAPERNELSELIRTRSVFYGDEVCQRRRYRFPHKVVIDYKPWHENLAAMAPVLWQFTRGQWARSCHRRWTFSAN